jgi:amino acid transporter
MVGRQQMRGLHRSVTWRSSLLLAVGAGLQVTVVMGAMAGELGNLHVLVWSGAALIGLVQCFLIAELAGNAPHRAGGVATYAQEAFGSRAPWLAALSGWGYWFAWTPGIAVNPILAAEYLHSTITPWADETALSLGIGAALYGLNTLGLRHLVRVSAVLMVLAGATLLALLVTPLAQPSLFHRRGPFTPVAAAAPFHTDRSCIVAPTPATTSPAALSGPAPYAPHRTGPGVLGGDHDDQA